MLGKRLNIALFASHLEDDYAKTICKGAMIGAQQTDSNLFIIPGRYFDNDYEDKERTRCQYQYDTLFSYVNSHSIDVLIIMMETIGSTWSYQRKLDLIKPFDDVKIVNIGPEIEDYFYVKFDNKTGLREGIEHIIKKHKRKRIGFVSGPVTNKDAIERLQVYKDTLTANGMEVEENLIEYGLYSDYSVESTERLLAKNPDIDAIIYSNDKMAMGGYEAIEKKGLKIGKDISVMGFDDTKSAMTLNPKLTTVRADAVEIGYRAVLCGIDLVKGNPPHSHIVDSKLILRSSCGCAKSGAEENSKNPMLSCSIDTLAETLASFTFEDLQTTLPIGDYKTYIENLFEIIISHVVSGDVNDEYIDADIVTLLDFLSDNGIYEYMSIDKFFYSMSTIMHYAEENIDIYKKTENITALSDFISGILCTMTTKFALEDSLHKHDLEYLSWMTNSLTRDMLSYVDSDEKSFGTVCEKFAAMNIDSSYIFTFGEPIIHKKGEVWNPPEKIYIKAYHNKSHVTVIPKNQQEIPTIDLFCNEHLPQDRQFTMVLSTLYSNTEQYGLMLSEMKYEQFYYIAPVTVQLCASIKSMYLIQQQEIIQQQLKETLEKIKQNNIILDNISKSDELTGVYNRRGFFEMAQRMACDKLNRGKHAIVVFADMDCLKVINDKFGHDEGDFSIKTIAEILSGSFRNTDIVGRIGGDEFAAFAIVECKNYADKVRERIKAKSEYINATSGKPYYINMSVGISEFECSPSVNVKDFLDIADEKLYLEKRNKVKVVFKEAPKD